MHYLLLKVAIMLLSPKQYLFSTEIEIWATVYDYYCADESVILKNSFHLTSLDFEKLFFLLPNRKLNNQTNIRAQQRFRKPDIAFIY